MSIDSSVVMFDHNFNRPQTCFVFTKIFVFPSKLELEFTHLQFKNMNAFLLIFVFCFTLLKFSMLMYSNFLFQLLNRVSKSRRIIYQMCLKRQSYRSRIIVPPQINVKMLGKYKILSVLLLLLKVYHKVFQL